MWRASEGSSGADKGPQHNTKSQYRLSIEEMRETMGCRLFPRGAPKSRKDGANAASSAQRALPGRLCRGRRSDPSFVCLWSAPGDTATRKARAGTRRPFRWVPPCRELRLCRLPKARGSGLRTSTSLPLPNRVGAETPPKVVKRTKLRNGFSPGLRDVFVDRRMSLHLQLIVDLHSSLSSFNLGAFQDSRPHACRSKNFGSSARVG